MAWIVRKAFFALAICIVTPGCGPGCRPAHREQQNPIPKVVFSNITVAAGIDFLHRNGAKGEKLLPETMGGGCGFIDYNNDSHPDIFLINYSTDVPTINLYKNQGNGSYTNVTAGSGLEARFHGMGLAAGDFNGDGFTDLFVTGVGEHHLFQNLGNEKFLDVTERLGLRMRNTNWSTSAAWFDYDRDGDLDLFVCNYVQWTRETDLALNYQLPNVGRAYGPPLSFPGSFSSLYRNEGEKGFTDVSETAGIQVSNKATGLPLGKALGVTVVDLEGDGWLDLIVANDTVQNFVFHNETKGRFKEIGTLSGLAFDRFGSPRGAMGIDSGRLEEGNTLAISIGNFANEMTALYLAQGNPLLFSDEALNQGIGTESRPYLTFGVFFFDYDLDGWLDLLTANGHIEPEIARAVAGQSYAQPAQLFWNARATRSSGKFLLVPPELCGPDLLQPIVGRGSAFADIDADGDLDVLFTQLNGPPLLLRNESNLKHNWLRVKLQGSAKNLEAIGAHVSVHVGPKVMKQQVSATRGYLSQSELTLTFGLGAAKQVDHVTVKWPSGKESTHPSPQINQVLTIRER